ncbi:MAG: signal peptidase I [bacterium]|nr:signal peptidase I [bacterium]
MSTPSKKPRPDRQPAPSRQKPSKGESVTVEYIKAILFAVGLALVIRTFVVQAFRIPSGSMEDTLLVGDFLLANKFVYGAKIPFAEIRLPALSKPKSGDIVIFQYPLDPDRDFIKRVVATAGDTVEIRDKILYVNSQRAIDPPRSKYLDPRILSPHTSSGHRDHFGPEKVPEGHYFVMGDNRDNSEDSRYWGFLDHKWIRAQAFILYWSWTPDVDAPIYQNLSSIPKIFFYNLFHIPDRTRWRRIGMLIE